MDCWVGNRPLNIGSVHNCKIESASFDEEIIIKNRISTVEAVRCKTKQASQLIVKQCDNLEHKREGCG